MKKNRRRLPPIKLGVRLPQSFLPKKHKKRQQSSPSSSPQPSSSSSSSSYHSEFNTITTPSMASSFYMPPKGRICFHDPFSRGITEKLRIQRYAFSCRDSFYYGPEDELRTCIWHDGHTAAWKQKSSRISWIGVFGVAATCVASMLDKESLRLRPRPPSGKHQLTVQDVLTTALADMFPGVGPNTSTDFGERMEMVKLSCSKDSKEVGPFAVVSVAPGFVGEEIGHEVQQYSLAVSFLKATLKGRTSLTSKETKQIAICALKCLLGPKFKSDKIVVNGSGYYQGEIEEIVSAHEVDQCLADAVQCLDVMDFIMSLHEDRQYLAGNVGDVVSTSFPSLGLSSP